jgi:hypothetical protein
MFDHFIGHLRESDPLHGYLRHHVLPQLGFGGGEARIRVHRLSDSRDVYLYEEKFSGIRVVGKFHAQNRGLNASLAPQSARHEFDNLHWLRSLGFDHAPHTVVRPLGHNWHIGDVLVTEFARGESLSAILDAAALSGQRDRLFRKLSALAHFLAAMHNRTAAPEGVDFDPCLGYLDRVLGFLQAYRGLRQDQADTFRFLAWLWRERGCMWEDNRVMVHGDATPANFLFGRGNQVLAIDLERMHHADRVYDVGRLCGEIKHAFLQTTGDPAAGEPFIGHFLWEYAHHFPDQGAAFAAVTRRVPFYLGLTLLRIARNPWISWEHSRRLFHEAKKSLRGLP